MSPLPKGAAAWTELGRYGDLDVLTRSPLSLKIIESGGDKYRVMNLPPAWNKTADFISYRAVTPRDEVDGRGPPVRSGVSLDAFSCSVSEDNQGCRFTVQVLV